MMQLRISVYLEQPPHQGGGHLQISENVEINVNTFLEACEILGQFHKLAEVLKEKIK